MQVWQKISHENHQLYFRIRAACIGFALSGCDNIHGMKLVRDDALSSAVRIQQSAILSSISPGSGNGQAAEHDSCFWAARIKGHPHASV